jgi:hypothetical protein
VPMAQLRVHAVPVMLVRLHPVVQNVSLVPSASFN